MQEHLAPIPARPPLGSSPLEAAESWAHCIPRCVQHAGGGSHLRQIPTSPHRTSLKWTFAEVSAARQFPKCACVCCAKSRGIKQHGAAAYHLHPMQPTSPPSLRSPFPRGLRDGSSRAEPRSPTSMESFSQGWQCVWGCVCSCASVTAAAAPPAHPSRAGMAVSVL